MTADTDDRQSIHSVRCAVLAGESSWHFKDLVRAAEKIKRAGQASIELRACRFEQLAGGLKSNQPSFSFQSGVCLLYTSPSPRDLSTSRMPSSA